MNKIIKEMPKRYPIDGTFELTVRCNLHCKMCLFRHDDSENKEIMENELSTAQWIDLAKQAAEMGTINLLLTGGEPMLRSDFCEIYEGIYKQGFLLTLYTNATLVSPEIMETLRKYPPHKIGVTIYGASSETYGRVCGNEEAFKKALDGVRQLQTLPSKMEFRMTIIKDNYQDAGAIEELVQEEFGKEYMVSQTRVVTKAVRGACADVESCRLEPKDNVRLALRRSVDAIKSVVGEENFHEEYIHIERPIQDSKKLDSKLTLLGCDAGMNTYTVSWDGKLLGCQMLGCFSTDILDLGLEKAWEQFPYEVKLPPLNEICKQCNMIDLCQCCYASRYAETGDLGGCPKYVCEDVYIINQMI